MTAAGELKRRLVLDAPVDIDDGAGGVTTTYESVTTLWAQVTPVGTSPDVSADSLGATQRYDIIIRQRDDVTTRHRFQDGGRIYRVLAVQESADRRFLEIAAEERVD